MSDDKQLIQITAPPSMHRDICKTIERAQDNGFFNGYEFLVTGTDVAAIDLDALAEKIAEKVDND